MGKQVDKPGLHFEKPAVVSDPFPVRCISRPILDTSRIYPDRAGMRVGIVVSTHGSPPLVHLQLESRRRFAPDSRCLVVDDCSTEGDALRELCKEYGAEFHSNPARLGHVWGDLSALVTGLRWASGFDLLVKLSRRFVWKSPEWLSVLLFDAEMWQMPTLGGICTHYAFPIRTECFAVHPGLWSAVIPRLESLKLTDLYERCLFEIAKLVPCPSQFPAGLPVVAPLHLLTDHKHHYNEHFLWHNACPPELYQSLAREWGLNYTAADFTVSK